MPFVSNVETLPTTPIGNKGKAHKLCWAKWIFTNPVAEIATIIRIAENCLFSGVKKRCNRLIIEMLKL